MRERAVADETRVFRAVRPGWLEEGRISYRAFLLRADEGGLSVSENQANAEAALLKCRGSAGLESGQVRRVADTTGRWLRLQVVPRVLESDPGYAWIIG